MMKELQELHSSLEEAKADIVGFWALRFLIKKEMLPITLVKSMYVSFLAGCFRSLVTILLDEISKEQALQYNWLLEKGAIVLHLDGTFSVNFLEVEEAVESLSREILTIQAKGDKAAAKLLLEEYGKMTEVMRAALDRLEIIQVPVDIAPIFGTDEKILLQNP
ncbi:hypothetical protein GIB67_035770 [Kingdonia uniflora]|uniref:Uncharacterized protein n=1 Tax=Kingdonia uniflora TaxID=39325 RepID=A0A7J7MJF4_9MAGN|nr:hypothetical protein GIB67_035770 [Kingdonia uniflora]